MKEKRKNRGRKAKLVVRGRVATAGVVSLLYFLEPRFMDGVCVANGGLFVLERHTETFTGTSQLAKY